MIVGDIRHYAEESGTYPAVIRKGLEKIAELGLAAKPPGRYELDSDGLMFALVQEPQLKRAVEQAFESHVVHVDIQYIVDGLESIYVFRHTPELPVREDQLQEKDYALYDELTGASQLVLGPGQFAVFYPWDVHKPCCQADGGGRSVKKIVINIHKQLWSDAAESDM